MPLKRKKLGKVLSKKKRHKVSSAKPKRRLAKIAARKRKYFEAKREALREVYGFGVGARLVLMSKGLSDIENLETKKKVWTSDSRETIFQKIFLELNALEKHYEETKHIFKRYKQDQDFQFLFYFQEKLPELRRMLVQLEQKYDKKVHESFDSLAIKNLSYKASDFREKILKEKYYFWDYKRMGLKGNLVAPREDTSHKRIVRHRFSPSRPRRSKQKGRKG